MGDALRGPTFLTDQKGGVKSHQRGNPLESPQIWSAFFCGFLHQEAAYPRPSKNLLFFAARCLCGALFVRSLGDRQRGGAKPPRPGQGKGCTKARPPGAERTGRRRGCTTKGAHHRKEQPSLVGLQRAVPFVGSFPHFCPHRNGAPGGRPPHGEGLFLGEQKNVPVPGGTGTFLLFQRGISPPAGRYPWRSSAPRWWGSPGP